MDIVIRINTENAAFRDAPELEVARILSKLASNIESRGLSDRRLMDSNGNCVGALEIADKCLDGSDRAETHAKLKKLAKSLGLDAEQVTGRFGVDPERTNNGGLDEVIALALKSDEPAWLEEQLVGRQHD